MSRQPNINHNVFDHFTVLQNVDNVSLKGRVFKADDVGGEAQNTLIGFDKNQHADFQYSYGGGEHDVLLGDFNYLAIRSVAFDGDAQGISLHEGALGSSESVSQYALSNVPAEIISDVLFSVSPALSVLKGDVDGWAPNVLVGTHDDPTSVALFVDEEGAFVPQADVPSITVEGVHVLEDNDIPLMIQVSLNDQDGQEILHIEVSNVPDGAVLSAGQDQGNGTWLLSPADLNDLFLNMPEHYSGEFSLTITAISTELTGEEAQSSLPLLVTVDPVVDAPELSVQSSTGFEDMPIALNVSAHLVDQDGSETLSLVTISDIPDGAVLSAGTQNPDGAYSLILDELEGLTITPSLHSNEDFTLSLRVSSTESDGQSITTHVSLPVSVEGVADTPIASAAFGGTIVEGVGSITGANVSTTDQGFRVLARNVNEDGSLTEASVDYVGVQGSNGFGASGDTDNAWVDAETGWNPNVGASEELIIQFDGLVLNAHASFGYFYQDWTGGIENGTVTAYRNGQEVGHIDFSAPDDRTLDISFIDQPFDELVFNAHPYSNVDEINPSYIPMDSSDFTVKELSFTRVTEIPSDTVMTQEDIAVEIGFGLSGELVDQDGSEILGYVISNVPDGAVLSAGLDNGDGTYSLIEADLLGLEFSPPEDFSGVIPLTFTVITTENDGDQALDSVAFNIQIEAVADVPLLDVQTARGLEDHAIDLSISGALVDADGSENLVIIISDIPDGAHLSAGSLNSDGSYTLLIDDLSGFQIMPPENSNETIHLKIEALSTDDNGDEATRIRYQTVEITGVADAPILDVRDSVGSEDVAVDLAVAVSHPDMDGSETFVYEISDVPDGAVFSVGTDLGDGKWSFSAQDLAHLSFTAPEHFSGDIEMALRGVSTENDGDQISVTDNFTVHVAALADEAVLSVNAQGMEDQDVPVTITVALADQDGSESITSITITDIPDGVRFSAGVLEDGVLSLSQSDLEGLTLRAPENSNVDFNLTLSVETVDENGTTAINAQSFLVDLKGDTDSPDVFAANVTGFEDNLIDMDFGGALNDLDGSERMYFQVRDVPEGVTFTTGRAIRGGRHWRFNNEQQAEEAQLIPPENFSGELNLTFRAYAKENDGNRTYSETEFSVSVTGEADAPRSFTVREARGFEDNEIALDIRYQLADQDGSEQFSISISDIPEGTQFSHGSETPEGAWIVLEEDIAHLTVIPPADSNENFTLSVTGMVTESDGDIFTFNDALMLPVIVRGVADMPSMDVSDRIGYEDTPLNLELDALLTDIDGSESLSVVISNIPEGVVLSPSGTYISVGTYSYTAEQAQSLTLVAPTDFSGAISLDVRAVAQENDGDVEVFRTQLHVDIQAIADAPHVSGYASGVEDTAFDLHVNVHSLDQDGSEHMADVIVISDVPEGAVLSAGMDLENGSYLLTQSDLDGLKITPPHDSNENFSLRVTVTSIDINGDDASSTQSLYVNVEGDADVPTLTVSDAVAAGGKDVSLDIHGSLVDEDGSESLYYIISDVPEIYQVHGGIYAGGADSKSGRVGRWIVRADDIDDVALEPLVYNPSDFQITVTAISQENDGDLSHTVLPLNIEIHSVRGRGGLPRSVGVSKSPRFSHVLGDTTYEDTQIDVDGTVHYDHGGELSFLIADIPEGVEPNLGFYDLDGGLVVPLDQISQLRFEPVDDFSGTIQMTYTAFQIQNGKFPASAEKVADVYLEAVADAPLIVASAVSGDEDSSIAIPLDIAVSDIDGSEHILSMVTIENVPEGGALSAGTDEGDGTWSVPLTTLAGLTFTAPAHAHGTFDLTITAVSEEALNSDQAVSSKVMTVTVNPIADQAVLNVVAGQGTEDQWLDLDISASFVDIDGSESMSIVISGLPDEARLSSGLNNGDGSWTLQPSQIEGLQVHAPDDFGGVINATVIVNTIEANGNVAVVSQNIPLSFEAVSDGLTLDTTMQYIGVEDQVGGIPIILNAEALDRDGSEHLEVTFSGYPEGARFSYGVDNGAGTWTIVGEDVNNAVFLPPEDFSGDIALEVHVDAVDVNGDRQGVDFTQSVSITPVADSPELMVGEAHYEGEAGQFILRDVSGHLADQDGSEQLSLSIRDVPDDVGFSSGVHQGNGVWLFEDASLESVALQTAPDFDGEFTLTLQAQAIESSSGDEAFSDAHELFFLLHAPILDAEDVSTNTDGWVEGVVSGGGTESSGESWLDTVDEGQSGADIQEGDPFDDVVDPSQNDVFGNDTAQDQVEGGLMS